MKEQTEDQPRPVVKTCDIRVHLGIDVPAYQTVSMKVPVSLIAEGKEEELKHEIALHVGLLESLEDLNGGWTEEWESSGQLRVVGVTADPNEVTEMTNFAGVVMPSFPLETNYWEIAHDLIDLTRRLKSGWQEPRLEELLQILRKHKVEI